MKIIKRIKVINAIEKLKMSSMTEQEQFIYKLKCINDALDDFNIKDNERIYKRKQ